MEYKQQLDKNHWETLKTSVMWIFRAVAGADGNIDTKEQLALKNVTENAVWIQNTLVREVLDDISSDIALHFRNSITDGRSFREGMADLLRILKNPVIEDRVATNFKKALIAIGFYVANVSGEEQQNKNVSNEEANVLKNLASILALTPEQLRDKPNIQSYMEIFSGEKKA